MASFIARIKKLFVTLLIVSSVSCGPVLTAQAAVDNFACSGLNLGSVTKGVPLSYQYISCTLTGSGTETITFISPETTALGASFDQTSSSSCQYSDGMPNNALFTGGTTTFAHNFAEGVVTCTLQYNFTPAVSGFAQDTINLTIQY